MGKVCPESAQKREKVKKITIWKNLKMHESVREKSYEFSNSRKMLRGWFCEFVVCSNYFSEKILNCLACKTIPIYWGHESVKQYFDTSNWLFFNDLEDGYEKIKFASTSAFESSV